MALKAAQKMGKIAIAAAEAYFGNALIAFAQQLGRPAQAQGDDVIHQRHAHHPGEHAGEILGRNGERPGRAGHGYGLGEMGVKPAGRLQGQGLALILEPLIQPLAVAGQIEQNDADERGGVIRRVPIAVQLLKKLAEQRVRGDALQIKGRGQGRPGRGGQGLLLKGHLDKPRALARAHVDQMKIQRRHQNHAASLVHGQLLLVYHHPPLKGRVQRHFVIGVGVDGKAVHSLGGNHDAVFPCVRSFQACDLAHALPPFQMKKRNI